MEGFRNLMLYGLTSAPQKSPLSKVPSSSRVQEGGKGGVDPSGAGPSPSATKGRYTPPHLRGAPPSPAAEVQPTIRRPSEDALTEVEDELAASAADRWATVLLL